MVRVSRREEAEFHEAAAGAGVRYTEGGISRKLGKWAHAPVRPAADVPKPRALPGVRRLRRPKATIQESSKNHGAVAHLVTAINMTGRRDRPERAGAHRARRHGGGDGHRHRLQRSRPRRLLRSGSAASTPASTSWATTSIRARPSGAADAVTGSGSGRLDGHGTHVSRHHRRERRRQGRGSERAFHAYRVFGCEGSMTADIMLAAMEMRAGGWRRRVEHEHRERALVAAVSDRQGRRQAREKGRGRGRLDRQ